MRFVAIALVVAGSVAGAARADDDALTGSAKLAPGERVDNVLVGKAASVPVLVVAPPHAPRGIVLLFPGGSGKLGLSDRGIAHGADNFVVRTRQRYADAGLVAIVVDGDGEARISDEAAESIRALVAWARDSWPKLPVWLVGTSRGTLSAANAAARGVAVDGLVLTSSVTAGKKEKLGEVATRAIRARTMFVHHVRDACSSSPVRGAEKLAKTMRATWKTFDGGAQPTGDACGPDSPHGFSGLDADVTAAIVDFIGARP